MDLESFLELEKRRIAEERRRLHDEVKELNSGIPLAKTFASMAPEDKNISYQPNEDDTLSKKTKDWINTQYNNQETDNFVIRKKKNHVADDMEQWVTDTFYSYFPGFNNEYQKRQNELQKRQRENQENLIKHQILNKGQSRRNRHLVMETSNINSARSNSSSLTTNGANGSLHGAGKTEMEIINVNNPNYIPSKHSDHSLRPDSARYRLLQDLRHTNFTNMANDSPEDAMEISRRQAEIESARKKQYQQELMEQIEEKRRTIKLLRDKELQQEEVLTRRLQEQLRTMKLEEQLEKERIKAAKVRFDTEQNRLTREHLLAKLESDSQLISDADLKTTSNKKPSPTLNNETNKENISDRQDNKVYKYFSNSENHEYRYRNKSSSSLPTEIDLELDHTELAKIERECFHLSEKICPMCDEPLKELQNFCLRCQNKISFRIKSPTKQLMSQRSESCENDCDKNSVKHDNESDQSFFLVCIRCERLYSWCRTCTSKSDLCRACQNKRNLCMACRKTLCSFCLEEVACGKDTESLHINDSFDAFEKKTTGKDNSPKEIAFHVMNNSGECVKNNNNNNKSSNTASLPAEYSTLNDLNNPSHSTDNEQNSVFHSDNKTFSLFSKNKDKNLKTVSVNEKNTSFYDKDFHLSAANKDDENIESLRRYTDKRLSRYLKNYGDLAYQTRGTQTTPTTTGRRDIVIPAEHNLSIPLLREMPKMTRMETTKLRENSKELENLQRRWDIPAVQKYTISPMSPKVVTQVGAIRKQLQIERLFSDDTDSY